MEQQPGVKVHLTPLELEGIWNLLGKLEALPTSKKSVPAGIHNAPALITHIKVVCLYVRVHVCGLLPFSWLPPGVLQALLKEHASDVPKLSYTGRPIIRWPKRVRARLNSAPWRRAEGPALKAVKAQEMYLIGSASPPAALLVPASSSGPASSAQTGSHAHPPSAAEARLLHVCAEETQSQVCLCFGVIML